MDDKQKCEELKRMYTDKDLSECFANLHTTFDKEIQKVNPKLTFIKPDIR
jgi:hypothetical protein